MEQGPIIMEIGVLDPDWDETVDYYSQILKQEPKYIDESKVLFHTSEYDLYIIKLAAEAGIVIAAKFPPTYYHVREARMVKTIYEKVLMNIPGAVSLQEETSILVFPVPDSETSDKKAIIITMASVVLKPTSACKAQVKMVLGVIHNPPY